MKDYNIQVIGSYIIVGILVIMMQNAILFAITPKILNKLHLTNDKINNFFQITQPNTANIDYSKLYPFEDTQTNKNTKTNIVQKYLSLTNIIKDKLEENTSKGLYGYERFIELSYIYDKILSYNIVSNSSSDRIEIEISDGYYTQLKPKSDMDKHAQSIIQFNDYLKESGINFLYVQAPSKVSKTQQLPLIYTDYSNENMDMLLKGLKNKVDYIDLREDITADGLDYLKLYYKTDHHWLPETGLWATNKISQYINKNYNMNLEIQNIDKDKYNYTIYPKIFLGSDGRYVSLANAKPEDFTLITPKFETELNIKIIDKDINKTGSYEETLIDWQQLKNIDFYKAWPYSSYMYGDKPLIEIKNEKVKNGKKILLVKDSYSEVVSPFLALENEYLSIIDLRYFNGSLKNYISKFKPDIVITLYSGFTISDFSNETSENHYLIERLNK